MALSRREMIKMKLMAASALLLSKQQSSAQSKTENGKENWCWFPGGALTSKNTTSDSGQVTSWLLSEANPMEGSVFHKHTHQDEVFYVVSGSFQIEVGDRSVVGGPGTIVQGPRDVPHRWTNIGVKPGRLMTAFTPAGLEKLFHSLAVPINSPGERPQVDMAALGARISRSVSQAGLIATGGTMYPFLEKTSV